jgi:hypothetical protein
MMRYNDFLPRKEADFYGWVNVFFTYLLNNRHRFGISNDTVAPLAPLRDSFMTAYAVASAPSTRTKAAVLTKNQALRALQAALRKFIREYLTFNHLVTDVDRKNLGLPVRKTARTPVPDPATYPEFRIDSATIRVLVIYFRDAGSVHRGKPFGIYGVEVRWGFSDTPVVNPEDLPRAVFGTRSPCRLVFDGEDRGRTVWFCLRWENSRGVKGPWSEIVSAIVP